MGKRTRRKREETISPEEIERTKKKRQAQQTHLVLTEIKPITDNQNAAFHSYYAGQNLVLSGMAGTGKTYVGLYLALNDLLRGLTKKVVIVRSAVSSRDPGFLPGTMQEKMAIYEAPYKDLLSKLFGRGDAYEILKKKGLVEFMSTSFLRGVTFDDSIILIDEVQNMTWQEIHTILTRVGNNTRLIICGDTKQNDLLISHKRQESGFESLLDICSRIKSIDHITFTIDDVVRGGFVKEFLIAVTYLRS